MTRRFIVASLLSVVALVTSQGTASMVHAYSNSPTSISVNSDPGTAAITVTWLAATGATKYQAQLRVGSSTGLVVKTSEVLSTSSRTTSFPGVEYNLGYVIGVQAGDGTGWGSYSFSQVVTPVAAAPSPPSKPSISSPSDGQLEFSWSAPTNNGGAALTNYVIQLFIGDEVALPPATTTGLKYTFKDLQKTGRYSANVKAVNSESKTSEASELSDAKTPSKESALSVAAPTNSPVSGGNNNAPTSGGNINQTAPSGSSGSPANLQTPPNLVSPLPALLSYSKLVKLKSMTSKSTLSSLSKLTIPKGSTTSFVISATSKKYCSLRGTSVYMIKTGTCAITFTVKTKSGKKTSRTVKLVVR